MPPGRQIEGATRRAVSSILTTPLELAPWLHARPWEGPRQPYPAGYPGKATPRSVAKRGGCELVTRTDVTHWAKTAGCGLVW
eukprot:4824378-Alexandrium_andersonii.AAC.1